MTTGLRHTSSCRPAPGPRGPSGPFTEGAPT